MRELNVKEIKKVNGGLGWLRWLRPTKMGNGELSFGQMYGGQCKVGVPVEMPPRIR